LTTSTEEWLEKWAAQIPARDEEWAEELLTIFGYEKA
jgi:hypothetical protein